MVVNIVRMTSRIADLADDWPDKTLRDFDFMAADRESIRLWVEASPTRAFSADGRYLMAARKGRGWSFLIVALGSTGGERSVEVIEEVISVRTEGESFRVELRLDQPTNERLGIIDQNVVLTFPQNPYSPFAGFDLALGSEEQFDAIVKFLGECGVMAGHVADMYREQQESKAVEEAEYAQLRQEHREFLLMAADESGRYNVPEWLRDRFDTAIREQGFAEHTELFQRLALPAVAIETSKRETGPLGTAWKRLVASVSAPPELGQTRFGGEPDLPKGVTWPRVDGELLSFLLQVNLAHLPEVTNVPFPKTGLLSFFSGGDDCYEGTGGKVIYSAGDLERVRLKSGEKFFDPGMGLMPEWPATLRATISLPPYGSEAYDLLENATGKPDDFCDRMERISTSLGLEKPFLGGHPESLHRDVVEELVYQDHDIDFWPAVCTRSKLKRRADQGFDEWKENLLKYDEWYLRRQDYARECQGWISLLCLDLDAGTLVLMIRRSAFEKRRFEDAYAKIIST